MGPIFQHAINASAVKVHTVAATAGALVLWNEPVNATAKHTQPRRTRVTNLFELPVIFSSCTKAATHESISVTAAST